MKYIVEVNAKYLVSIEAESALNAEHKILEYNGVWGALAFDQKMVKTDTFAGAVQGCEMISMNELIAMAAEVTDTKAAADKANKEEEDAGEELKKIEEMLKAAQKNYREAHQKAYEAKARHQMALHQIGKQPQ